MERDTLSERLKALEARVKATGSSGAGRKNSAQGKYTQSSLAWRMVTELVSGMLLGLGIGFGLDSLVGTEPLFLILFVLLGFAGGVRAMMRTADDVRKKKSEGALLSGDDDGSGPEGSN